MGFGFGGAAGAGADMLQAIVKQRLAEAAFEEEKRQAAAREAALAAAESRTARFQQAQMDNWANQTQIDAFKAQQEADAKKRTDNEKRVGTLVTTLRPDSQMSAKDYVDLVTNGRGSLISQPKAQLITGSGSGKVDGFGTYNGSPEYQETVRKEGVDATKETSRRQFETERDKSRQAFDLSRDAANHAFTAEQNRLSREATNGPKAADRAAAQDAVQRDRTEVHRLATEIMNDSALDSNVGRLDSLTPTLWESSKNWQSKVNRLKGMLTLDARQKLKGQGQISDKESQMLADAVAALETAGSETEFKKELQRIIDSVSDLGKDW